MNSKIIENPYFAAKILALGSDLYCDLRRKQPLPLGVGSFHVELLATIIDKAQSSITILTPTTDRWLIQELQSLGLKFKGYAIQDTAGMNLGLWDGEQCLSFVELGDELLGGTKIIRMTFSLDDSIQHNLHDGAAGWFEIVRAYERIFSGITVVSGPDWQSKSESEQIFPKTDLSNSDLYNVLLHRQSASFSSPPKGSLYTHDLDSIISSGFVYSKVGGRPYPSAGGVYSQEIFAVTDGVQDLGNGVYKYDPSIRKLVRQCNLDDPKIFWFASLKQQSLEFCQARLFILTRVNDVLSKYGRFSYRNMLLDSGALLQTLHLVCISKGVGSRIFAGVDDRLVESLLDVPQDCVFTGGIALGRLE